MKEISQRSTPTAYLFISSMPQMALGDGSFLAFLEKVLQLMGPFLVGCMPSKEALIANARDINSDWNQDGLLRAGRWASRRAGVPWFRRHAVANAAAQMYALRLEAATDQELSACYDELNPAA